MAAIAANVELIPRRYPDLSAGELQRRTLRRLIAENDLTPEDVDGVYVAPPGRIPRELAHDSVYDKLGVRPSVSSTVYAGGATYGIMLRQAIDAIERGRTKSVLCLGAGKFLSTDEGGDTLARRVSHEEFEYPYGGYPPTHYALFARRYMHEFGVTKTDLSHTAVTTREWAVRNPAARMNEKGPIDVDDVLDSQPIAEPFHRLHCSVPTEGGGAFLVTTDQRARTIASQPAYVRGTGEVHSHGYVSQAPSFIDPGIEESATEAYSNAGLSAEDVDVAQIYDAFASTPPMCAEALGLAPAGKGPELFGDGRAGPGGSLPINTSGGLLSYGHTGVASGMSVLNEAITQTMNEAEDRQVPDAEVSLAHTYGGILCDHSTVLFGRDPT